MMRTEDTRRQFRLTRAVTLGLALAVVRMAVFAAMAECAPSLRDRSRVSSARPLTVSPDTFTVVDANLSTVAASVDYLSAITQVRASGNTQLIVPAVEAA